MLRSFKKKKKNIILIGVGALSFFTSAPRYYFILMFFMISFLYQEIFKSKRLFNTFKIALAFGYGYYLSLTYWTVFSALEDYRFLFIIPIGLIILPLYLSLFLSVCLSCFYIIQKNIKNEIIKAILFAIFWILHEKLREFILIPFPWWPISMTLLNINEWIQIISIIGIDLFGFFAILLYLLPSIAIAKINHFWKTCFILCIISLHLGFIYYGYNRIKNAEKFHLPFNIIAVQPNYTQITSSDDYQFTLRKHYFDTKDLLKNLKTSSLVVWSETSIPYRINPSNLEKHQKEYFNDIKKMLKPNDKIIFGAHNVQKNTNAMFLLNKNGIANNYDKINLVPFGEYVPILGRFDIFKNSELGKFVGGFESGEFRKIWKINDFSVVPLICYEIIFDHDVKKMKPELIVNISNDGWFGNTIGPDQHFAHAKISAIKNNSPLIRVANKGKSALFDKYGRIINHIEKNKDDAKMLYRN